MTLDNEKARELFNVARDLPSAKREPFLDKECGSNDELRAEVESLLSQYIKPTSFPTIEAVTQSPESYPPTEHRFQSGDRIGNFEIIKTLGEGGFGTVYLAKQHEPVERDVALKVLHANRCTEKFIRGFEEERQILAEMNHPGIAHFYDAGFTQFNQPYFVMEYVDGDPITEYCDNKNLTIAQRLKLFAEVCKAVQHAHNKLVIHRDLTPNNILVTDDDEGNPRAKIIDFGISKSGDDSTEDVAGTLQYMSPEQATRGKRVDAKSDIFTLGVVLYELLVGRPPLDAEMFQKVALHAQFKLVQEQEPPDPSTKLSGLHDASLADSIASARQEKLESLIVKLRRELDWIPRKALQKDPDRRYTTASAFASDIVRYLQGEAIEAAPDSTAYRTKKLFKRNKGKFIAAATLLFVLVGGITFTLYYDFDAKLKNNRLNATNNLLHTTYELSKDLQERTIGNEEDQSSEPDLTELTKCCNRCEVVFAGEESVLLNQYKSMYTDFYNTDNYEVAIFFARRIVNLIESQQESSHIYKRDAMLWTHQLGHCLRLHNDYQKSIDVLKELIPELEHEFGRTHKLTLDTYNDLAWAYYDSGHRIPAKYAEDAFKGRLEHFSMDSDEVLWSELVLAHSLRDKDTERSETHYRDIVEKLQNDGRATDAVSQSILNRAKFGLLRISAASSDESLGSALEVAKEVKHYFVTTLGERNVKTAEARVWEILIEYSLVTRFSRVDENEELILQKDNLIELVSIFQSSNANSNEYYIALMFLWKIHDKEDNGELSQGIANDLINLVKNNPDLYPGGSYEDLKMSLIQNSVNFPKVNAQYMGKINFDSLPKKNETLKPYHLNMIRDVISASSKAHEWAEVLDAFFLFHYFVREQESFISKAFSKNEQLALYYSSAVRMASAAAMRLGFITKMGLYDWSYFGISEYGEEDAPANVSQEFESYYDKFSSGEWILEIEYVFPEDRATKKSLLQSNINDFGTNGSQENYESYFKLALIYQLEGNVDSARKLLCDALLIRDALPISMQQLFEVDSKYSYMFGLLMTTMQSPNHPFSISCDF